MGPYLLLQLASQNTARRARPMKGDMMRERAPRMLGFSHVEIQPTCGGCRGSSVPVKGFEVKLQHFCKGHHILEWRNPIRMRLRHKEVMLHEGKINLQEVAVLFPFPALSLHASSALLGPHSTQVG